MEYKMLGNSGLRIPVLSFGTATFGGVGDFFKAWGTTDLKEAQRLIGICLEHGINMFDTSDMYSNGKSEEILGAAIKEHRENSILCTKATFRTSPNINDIGSSRHHLIKACNASLKRLGTDYIDLYQMHGFDSHTPVEETLSALDNLIQSGKVRYIGCSNFSGWQLMKSLATSEKLGLAKYVVYQGYYSLLGREYEWELMPLALDQKIGLLVWSPLGYGRLTGKVRRGAPLPKESRLHQVSDLGPMMNEEFVYKVVDVLFEVAEETGKTVAQVALNWLLQRPTVCNIILGARNEEQLKQNLGAVGWNLTKEQVAKLDDVSKCQPIYPYWHQKIFPELISDPV